MDLSREPSQDEERIFQRQLYRSEQTKPAPTIPVPAPTRTIAKPSIPTVKSKALVKNNIPSSRWKKSLRRTLLAILLLLGLAAGSYYAFLPDPVEQIKEGFKELRNLPREERGEKFKQLREDMSKLSFKQRNEVFKERRQTGREKLDKFFKLSKEEQIAELKKEIKAREERRQRWMAERATNGGGNGANGQGGRGTGAGGAGRGARGSGGTPGAESGRNANGPNTSGQPNGGQAQSGGGGGGWGNAETRNQRQKDFIDAMDPEGRAEMSLYRQMRQQIRQQMGFGNGPGGFGGPPFGGGRNR